MAQLVEYPIWREFQGGSTVLKLVPADNDDHALIAAAMAVRDALEDEMAQYSDMITVLRPSGDPICAAAEASEFVKRYAPQAPADN
ncbi:MULTISPECIES: hypothetical protein [unclassified Methylobacterium]|uniref:hypothetical protein n=1 Tax=unclassified Methylobacterium TaxID=2615210 RepID=UPI00226AC3CC|nr:MULTISPECIES: hypothetical protein [unclassified Methylobacterium]